MLFLCSSSLLTLRFPFLVPKFIHLSWNTSLEVGMAPPPLRGQSGSSGKWGGTQQEAARLPSLGPVESSRSPSLVSRSCLF